MSPFLISIVFSFVLTILATIFRRNSRPKLPPGPCGLPLIGHLHMLGKLPHQTLHGLAQKYGPIMSIRLGLKTAIIISSPHAAELFLKTYDTNFTSRPKTEASEIFSYGFKGIVYSDIGPYWRSVRKLCRLELLSLAKIKDFEGMRKEEVQRLVERLRGARGAVVDVSEEVERALEDMGCRMVFGKYLDDRFDLKGTINEVLEITGAFNITDFLPFLRPFDIQGLTRRMKPTITTLDEILEKIIHDHEEDATGTQSQPKDFMNELLSMKHKSSSTPNESSYTIERENIKAILLDLLIASPSVLIEWAMSELLRNPKVLLKLQNELRNVIGKDRMVEEADLTKLEFLDMVIKETSRLHPATPFLIPRICSNDITIDGYFIPKSSRVMVNTWTLGRDIKIWTHNAEEFIPERFIGSDIDFKGKHFQFLPFGSGRRVCPGITLGLTNIRLVLAQLVHCFDWVLPKGTSPSELDMNEQFGLSLSRAKPLLATPTYGLDA